MRSSWYAFDIGEADICTYTCFIVYIHVCSCKDTCKDTCTLHTCKVHASILHGYIHEHTRVCTCRYAFDCGVADTRGELSWSMAGPDAVARVSAIASTYRAAICTCIHVEPGALISAVTDEVHRLQSSQDWNAMLIASDDLFYLYRFIFRVTPAGHTAHKHPP